MSTHQAHKVSVFMTDRRVRFIVLPYAEAEADFPPAAVDVFGGDAANSSAVI